MAEYSILIKCDSFERMNEILLNMEEIAKRRIERKDNRGFYMKMLHKRTKEYQEENPEKPYKECLAIIAEKMKHEKQEVMDISGGDCLDNNIV